MVQHLAGGFDAIVVSEKPDDATLTASHVDSDARGLFYILRREAVAVQQRGRWVRRQTGNICNHRVRFRSITNTDLDSPHPVASDEREGWPRS